MPVLVLSAVTGADQALAAGADAYLRKPYVVEELMGAIRRLLPVATTRPGRPR